MATELVARSSRHRAGLALDAVLYSARAADHSADGVGRSEARVAHDLRGRAVVTERAQWGSFDDARECTAVTAAAACGLAAAWRLGRSAFINYHFGRANRVEGHAAPTTTASPSSELRVYDEYGVRIVIAAELGPLHGYAREAVDSMSVVTHRRAREIRGFRTPSILLRTSCCTWSRSRLLIPIVRDCVQRVTSSRRCACAQIRVELGFGSEQHVMLRKGYL
jgi:hypothetical protein